MGRRDESVLEDQASSSTPEGDTELMESLVREGDLAGDYIERFLDITDTDGDIELDVRDGRPVVAVVGDHLSSLVGPRGATLEALQDLTRMAVGQQTGERCRLILDIGGHRDRRRKELVELAKSSADKVLDTGEPVRLTPMNAFERKIVHDEVAAISGLTSESEGEVPERRVVILPLDPDDE